MDGCVHPRLVLPRLVSLVEVALIEQLTKVPLCYVEDVNTDVDFSRSNLFVDIKPTVE